MTAKTAEQIWSEVRAELRAMHEPFQAPFDAALDIGQTGNLMKLAALVGYRLGVNDTADVFEKAIP